jgi:fumarate hydratase subunit alpha
MTTREAIVSGVGEALVRAGTTFREDQDSAYRQAIDRENNERAAWVLETILENSRIARKNRTPLCDDTGIPHLFIELGQEAAPPPDWLSAVHEGIAQGLRAMPGRPMAVRGGDRERIEQSQGLYSDPGRLLPGPALILPVPGNRLKVTVLLLGGGPEIRAKTYRVFHKRSLDRVLETAAGWLAAEAGDLGCTPIVAAVGLGRSHTEAAAMMIQAMAKGDLSSQNEMETRITDLVNRARVGPLGLGGKTTALGAMVRVGPQRASGVRIVSARPCCCFEPRRATAVF